MDLLVARSIIADGDCEYFDSISPEMIRKHKIEIPDYSKNAYFSQKVLEKIKKKYPLLVHGNNLWECKVFLPTGRVVSSGSSDSFSHAACKAALLTAIEEDRHRLVGKKNRIKENLNCFFKGDFNMQKKDKKWHKSLIKIFSFFIAGLILLGCWNVFLAKEIKKSDIEREELKKNIERVKIMEIVNMNGMEEVVRHKAIGLCFWELLGKYVDRYSHNQIENCILLIEVADELYGYRGLDAPLIFAWLQKESAGNPTAVSWAGAKGLTQLMDFRADQIFSELGYAGFDLKLIYTPEINLAGGIHHLESLMRYWESQGIRSQALALFYAIHSYKWGSLNTLQLFNSEKRDYRPAIEYVNWILNRREKWVKKMKDLLETRCEMEEKINIDFGIFDLSHFMLIGLP